MSFELRRTASKDMATTGCDSGDIAPTGSSVETTCCANVPSTPQTLVRLDALPGQVQVLNAETLLPG